jgi:hypothetical protein
MVAVSELVEFTTKLPSLTVTYHCPLNADVGMMSIKELVKQYSSTTVSVLPVVAQSLVLIVLFLNGFNVDAGD